MEFNEGNLAILYTGLQAKFEEAVREAEVPDAMRLVTTVPSTTYEEQYPTAGLFGDLEELLDELAMTNLWQMVQSVPNVVWARGLAIKRVHMEDNRLGLYNISIQRLGRVAATHAARRIPRLLIQGFVTNWIDAVPLWSNNHSLLGGAWTFDNLDHLPLTAANFETVVRNLETRRDPDGKEMGLTATVLVVGKPNKATAQRILKRQFIGGGNSNEHYEECDLMVLPNLGESWFVVDDSDVKPFVLQERNPAELESQTTAASEAPFMREEFIYKARRRYGMQGIAPWVVQAVDWGATDAPTTTTTARA